MTQTPTTQTTSEPAPADAPWRAEYPFESHFLALDGRTCAASAGQRLHYVDEGEGDPVLMLHGNPTWSFYYRKLALALKDRQRVVVPDHLGCGLSDKPQDHPYQLAQHIDHVEQLCEELALDRLTVVVHDWGGPIGFGYATRHPERVRRLVVLNTAAFQDTRCPWRIRACRIPGFGALAVRGFNAFAGAATWMAVARPMTATARAGYVAPYDSWANRIATLRFVEDIPLSPSHPTHATIAAIESKLDTLRETPMALIWGMRDWCFSPHFLRRFQDIFPAAEAHELADAHHLVLEDAPDRVIRLVTDFLDRHPLS